MNVLLLSLVLSQVYLPSGDYATVPGKTSVCQCGGSNRGVCHCLANNVPCRCTPSKGSIWNLNDNGKAVSKTGDYADPSTKVSAPKPASTHYQPSGDFAIPQLAAPTRRVYYTECRNGVCRRFWINQ